MPGVGTTPYDNTDYVLNIARSLGNDAIQSLAGNLLNDNQPYVPVYLNSGYRWMQRELANAGYSRFKKTVMILEVPIIGVRDPAATVSISYTGTFDGVSNHASPVLPADMCWPLRLKERQSGTVQVPKPMFLANDGLVSRPQSLWLRDWYWEAEEIVLCGATQVNDIQLLYTPFLPELVVAGEGAPSLIPILRCENALAAFTLWAFAFARGSALADSLMAMGKGFVKQMLASDSNLKQRKNTRRRGYSQRVHNGWGWM